MSKVSIIIPSCNEKYLTRTVQDIYEKATGEIEVIIGINGKTEYEIPSINWFERVYKKDNLIIVQIPENIGLKPMINKLASLATGKYLLKADAHTMWGKGFDEILKSEMKYDWVVTPRFYVLDAEKWQVQDERFYDYFYLCCPFTDPRGIRFKAGGHWMERTQERLESHPSVDETPSMHGSAWFVNREYFLNTLGGFPEEDPMGHAQEPIWLGLKNWLIDGKLMVNKRTWYAHLHQNSKDRGYPEDHKHTEDTYRWTADYWLTNSNSSIIYDFEWFVNKFMPMPSWSDNWKELYEGYLRSHS